MDLQEEAAGRQQFAETLRKVAGDQGRPAMVSSVLLLSAAPIRKR